MASERRVASARSCLLGFGVTRCGHDLDDTALAFDFAGLGVLVWALRRQHHA